MRCDTRQDFSGAEAATMLIRDCTGQLADADKDDEHPL